MQDKYGINSFNFINIWNSINSNNKIISLVKGTTMANNNWMKDPRLENIEPGKLEFLQKLVFEMQNLSDKEKLPFLMALASSTRKQNISFDKGEMSTIIEVIKENSSPEELEKVNKLLSMFAH